MVGLKFGKWTVEAIGKVVKNRQYYICRCSCNKVQEISEYNLVKGRSTMCRSCAGGLDTTTLLKPGQRVGSWLLLEEIKTENKRRSFLCECACGVQSIIPGYDLRSGRSSRCNKCKLGILD